MDAVAARRRLVTVLGKRPGPSLAPLWPTVATPLSGPALDEVVLGIDEDANVLWAVERRLAGRDVPSPERPTAAPADGPVDATARVRYGYRASGYVPPHWHPYRIEEVAARPGAAAPRRRLVQHRLADLSGRVAELTPEPASDLLHDPGAAVEGPERFEHPVHQVEPSTVPTDGLRLERRYVLGRRTDGTPVLWTQRRRMPLLSPPGLVLRFDAFEPVPSWSRPSRFVSATVRHFVTMREHVCTSGVLLHVGRPLLAGASVTRRTRSAGS